MLFRIGTFLLWPTILAGIIALCVVVGKFMIEGADFISGECLLRYPENCNRTQKSSSVALFQQRFLSSRG